MCWRRWKRSLYILVMCHNNSDKQRPVKWTEYATFVRGWRMYNTISRKLKTLETIWESLAKVDHFKLKCVFLWGVKMKEWILVLWDTARWWILGTVINFRLTEERKKNDGNSWLSEWISAPEDGDCSVQNMFVSHGEMNFPRVVFIFCMCFRGFISTVEVIW